MTTISDEFMQQMGARARPYCLVLLHAGPKRSDAGAAAIIWEHGRRNHALRLDGVMPIVCPVRDDSDLAGVCIFNAPLEQVGAIMDADPAVQAGVLTYEAHVCHGFPGDCLPES
jgi:hypothetical protein